MFYQSKICRKSIIIGIPVLISVIGIIISILPKNSMVTGILIFAIFVLCIVFIFTAIDYGKQECDNVEKIKSLEKDKHDLSVILKHNELVKKANMHTINSISQFSEAWARNIYLFAEEVKNSGTALEKYWDKVRLYDLVCEKCRDMIESFVGNNDHTKISVGFIECKVDANNNDCISFVAHSNPASTRPRTIGEIEKLSDSSYYYAELIRNKNMDIEVALNNNEILHIFKKTSKESDLSKYTQYIAVPIFCSRNKMLGIFQIVTKHGYVIIDDKIGLKSFAESNIIPFSNLILLIDKISKGLYAKPLDKEA